MANEQDRRNTESTLALQNAFDDYLKNHEFKGHISHSDYQQLKQQAGLPNNATSDDHNRKERLALLSLAAKRAHPPISKFHVGAIAEGLSGDLYFGANVEFSGVGLNQSIHAEQSAISHAWMKGEKGIRHITINYAPCGHCRQFMNELSTANELIIQLPELEAKSLPEFLPFAFGPNDLEVSERLMSNTNANYQLTKNLSPLEQVALDAANLSHAPYSQHAGGVALMLDNGEIIGGRYAENAAFNPSLAPLQVALNLLLLSGYSFSQIKQACLVERANSPISHAHESQALLKQLVPSASFLAVNIPD